MTIREQQLKYITQHLPCEFGGKDNWLGVKMSPHTSMEFVNEVTTEGVVTSKTSYTWAACPDTVIATIFQRLKYIQYERSRQAKHN